MHPIHLASGGARRAWRSRPRSSSRRLSSARRVAASFSCAAATASARTCAPGPSKYGYGDVRPNGRSAVLAHSRPCPVRPYQHPVRDPSDPGRRGRAPAQLPDGKARARARSGAGSAGRPHLRGRGRRRLLGRLTMQLALTRGQLLAQRGQRALLVRRGRRARLRARGPAHLLCARNTRRPGSGGRQPPGR